MNQRFLTPFEIEFCRDCGGRCNSIFPDNPFPSYDENGVTTIGVMNFIPYVECPHCKADDDLLHPGAGRDLVLALREKFRRGEVNHHEFCELEIKQLAALLGVGDGDEVPQVVKQEVFEYLNVRKAKVALPPVITASEIRKQFSNSSIPEEYFLQKWNPETGEVTLQLDVSAIISILGRELPRPFTSMWRRYSDLKEQQDSPFSLNIPWLFRESSDENEE